MLIPDRLDDIFTEITEYKEREFPHDIEPGVIFFMSDGTKSSNSVAHVMAAMQGILPEGRSPAPLVVRAAILAKRLVTEAVQPSDVKIDGFVFGCEVMFRSFDDPDAADEAMANYQHGDMQREFAENPGAQEQEAIVAVVIEDDLCGGWNTALVMQSYTRTEGGGMEWGERVDSLDVDRDRSAVLDAALDALSRPIPDHLKEIDTVDDIMSIFTEGGDDSAR